jgi:hypothetical protein
MTWLLESPVTIIVLGSIVELMLVVALVRTGRGGFLWALIGAGAVTGALVVMERLVVTDREQIEQTFDQLSATLVTNDVAAVLKFIAPSATDVRKLAEMALPQVKIKRALITDSMAVDVNHGVNPPTAEARFIGRFDIQSTPKVPYESIIRRFRIGLIKENDRWLINKVEDSDPLSR